MKISVPPHTTWTYPTWSAKTTNWLISRMMATWPWWLTTVTCVRTSKFRMVTSAHSCVLTSTAARNCWYVSFEFLLNFILLLLNGKKKCGTCVFCKITCVLILIFIISKNKKNKLSEVRIDYDFKDDLMSSIESLAFLFSLLVLD